ncbi:MAG: globin [Proteobacteria bacterium]|jgi:hemoglobin|nr:MAG: globin [Pseudomonadota bacterium]
MNDTSKIQENPATNQPRVLPYDLLGGDAAIRRLAAAFYKAMTELPEAQTIRAMHKDDLSEIEEKLYEYLSGWLGGPHHYLKKYGAVCLTKPHAPYPIGAAERDQWLLCMDKALNDIGASEEVKAMVKKPFFAIAEMMRNRD